MCLLIQTPFTVVLYIIVINRLSAPVTRIVRRLIHDQVYNHNITSSLNNNNNNNNNEKNPESKITLENVEEYYKSGCSSGSLTASKQLNNLTMVYHAGDGPEFDETKGDRDREEMKQHTIEMVTRGGGADSKVDHYDEYNNGDESNRDRYVGATAVDIPIHESRQISTSFDIPPEPDDLYNHNH